jgi:hypothetical protein
MNSGRAYTLHPSSGGSTGEGASEHRSLRRPNDGLADERRKPISCVAEETRSPVPADCPCFLEDTFPEFTYGAGTA